MGTPFLIFQTKVNPKLTKRHNEKYTFCSLIKEEHYVYFKEHLGNKTKSTLFVPF
jgi:hypothetical protein